jgi:hypothetical protein
MTIFELVVFNALGLLANNGCTGTETPIAR